MDDTGRRVLSMDDLEHHKENVQPLKSGRSASALAQIYGAQGPTMSATQLETQRVVLQKPLEDPDRDPTLEQFYAYLKFLQQYYPVGHADFKPYLQEAVRLFKRDERFKNDTRLFWMWMEVIKLANAPVEVFKYLSVNEIGVQLASYYIEYAGLMIEMKRFEDANEIYRLGINRKAQPLDKLIQSYEDFQQIPHRESEKDEETGTATQQSGRATSRPGFPNENEPAPIKRPALAPRSGSSRAAPVPMLQQAQTAGRAKLQIFRDPSEKEAPAALAARVMPSNTTANEWNDIGTTVSRKKENIREATKWTGTTLPQKGSGRGAQAAPPRTRIEVYQDEPSGSDLHVPTSAENFLQEKKVEPSSGSATAAMLATIDSTAPSTKRPVAAQIPAPKPEPLVSKPPSQKAVKPQLPSVMVMSTELMLRDGKWITSFEELRAAHYASLSPPATPAAVPARTFAQKAKNMASPTVNTKAAMADVFEMFSKPLQSEGAASNPASNAGGIYVDDDETISAKVYRREDLGMIGVLEDDDDDDDEDEAGDESVGRYARAPPWVTAIGVDKENPFKERPSHTLSDNGKAEHGYRDSATSAQGQDRASVAHAAESNVRMEPAYHSTPHHRRHLQDSRDPYRDDNDNHSDENDDDGGAGYFVPTRRGLAIMTPITEVSHESDRTMALSTIGRSYARMPPDDGHTVMTMATFGDRTISSISYDGSHQTNDAEEDDHDHHDFVGQRPATAFKAEIGIGRMARSDVGMLTEGLSGLRILSDDDAGSEGESTSKDLRPLDHHSVSPESTASIRRPASADENRSGESSSAQNGSFPAEGSSQRSDHVLRDVPNPCDPMDEPTASALVATFDNEEIASLYRCNKQALNVADMFEKAMKIAEKASSGKVKSSPRDVVDATITLPDGKPLKLIKKLGEGGFGRVYLVGKMDGVDEALLGGATDDGDDGYDSEESDGERAQTSRGTRAPTVETSWALKVQPGSSPWEYLILHAVRQRLPFRFLASVVSPVSCHVFQNESCTLLGYGSKGTLLDCVNAAGQHGYGSGVGGMGGNPQTGVDEVLAAFWGVEMLKTIEAVHATGIVHRDIKVDNFLVRLDEGQEEWEGVYKSDGTCGWEDKGVVLIDWGTSIDTRRFEPKQRYVSDLDGKKTEGRGAKANKPDPSVECWELRNDRSWTYEPDWYGAAGVLHVLLFGRYMEVIEDASDRDPTGRPTLKIATNFKRYWQVDLWKSLFDLLLNAGSRHETVGQMATTTAEERPLGGPGTDYPKLELDFPSVIRIREARQQLEMWLVGTSARTGKNLRGLLKRVGSAALDRTK
ncbi:hypothetical protein HKX48_006047 [Thoreauomyces humboldtii]|nr:hypothetical protein HKX48_006047 [Thoreauomyces humboldtii]